ncbi:MAG: C25 family cysteine peptidase, partial [Aquificaceae bacterium]|nr:C25 family cysteine peptidase [Aquificaceae bacterium]
GDFHALSEASASFLTAPYTPIRLYCVGASPTNSDCPEEEAGNIRRRLFSEWENGALIVQFAGHASWQQWALERFLHLEDLPSLRNDRRLPIVLGMTCFTGSFHRPEPTLDEALLLQKGGAVATWGSTGLGIARGHDQLSQGFFQAIFEDHVFTIGEATMQGKLQLLQSGRHLDLLDTFVLLGDPATRIDRTILPWSSRIYLPLILR